MLLQTLLCLRNLCNLAGYSTAVVCVLSSWNAQSSETQTQQPTLPNRRILLPDLSKTREDLNQVLVNGVYEILTNSWLHVEVFHQKRIDVNAERKRRHNGQYDFVFCLQWDNARILHAVNVLRDAIQSIQSMPTNYVYWTLPTSNQSLHAAIVCLVRKAFRRPWIMCNCIITGTIPPLRVLRGIIHK